MCVSGEDETEGGGGGTAGGAGEGFGKAGKCPCWKWVDLVVISFSCLRMD